MTSPAYRVRVSAKARHARLKVSARDGIVVTVPKGFDEGRLPAILERKRDWIRRTQERFAEQRKFLAPEPSGRLPERLTLRVVGQEWAVHYRQTEADSVTAVQRNGQRLLVYGNVEDEQAVKDALRRWLARQTHEYIGNWAVRLAAERSFDVARVVVKSQRTRWASFSRNSTLSLNLRLLFLPQALVRYVLLHELAHVREMNHSRRFWAVVESLDQQYVTHDRELRASWRLVPAWIGSAELHDTDRSPLSDFDGC